jgi:hypothetical protein
MAKRMRTSYEPYRVISVSKGRAGRTADFQEAFKDEASARKRAEKLASDASAISVYIQKLDADGYPEQTIPIKKPSHDE